MQRTGDRRSGRGRLRGAQGYTLTELLVALGILIALLGVVAPSVFAARKALRTYRLNSRAQAIYNTVQNRTAALQSAGKLQELKTTIRAGGNRIARPADYTWADDTQWAAVSDAGVNDYDVYYVCGSSDPDGTIPEDDAVTRLLMTDEAGVISHDLYGGTWVIELSPTTGEVYAVFYWEGSNADLVALAKDAAYQELCTWRGEGSLADHAVGYYRGGELSKSIAHKGEKTLDLKWRLVNSEELYVMVYSDDWAKLGVSDLNKVQVTVYVTGPNAAGNTVGWKYVAQGSTDLMRNNGSNEVDVILDSMRDPQGNLGGQDQLSFYHIMRGDFGGTLYTDDTFTTKAQATDANIIRPGADITVRVEVNVKNPRPGNLFQGEAYPGMATRTTNSTVGAFAPGEDDNRLGDGSVYVWATRHLQNLHDTSADSTTYRTGKRDALGRFTHLALSDCNVNAVHYTGNAIDHDHDPLVAGVGTGDIDFDWGNESPYVVASQSRTTGGHGHNPLQDEAEGFAPLTLSDWSWGEKSSITGIYSKVGASGKAKNASHTISNFVIAPGQQSDEVGLFSTVGAHVSYLDLVDFRVVGDAGVGTLAGVVSDDYHQYVTLDHVRAYANDLEDGSRGVWGRRLVGGLIGSDSQYGSGDVTNCASSLNVTGSGSYVGGLFGVSYSQSISSCAVGQQKGGLAGVPTITSDGYSAGGLAGLYGGLATDDAPNLARCSVVANVQATKSYAGGLAGYTATATTIKGCTVGSDMEPTTVTARQQWVGGLVGRMAAGGSQLEDDIVVANVSSAEAGMVGGLVGEDAEDGTTTIVRCDVGDASLAKKHQLVVAAGAAGKGDAHNVGGLVGKHHGGNITGADKKSSVLCDVVAYNGGNHVGGLVGNVLGNATVSNYQVGNGDVTVSVSSQLQTSYAYDADQQYVGGLFGQFDGATGTGAKGCTVTASVSGGGFTGGAFGWLEGEPKVEKVYVAYGSDVTGADSTGGFAGRLMDHVQILDSHAQANVEGTLSVGGFVGQVGGGNTRNARPDIRRSYVRGNPQGNDQGQIHVRAAQGQVGGFIGRAYGSDKLFVTRCEASAQVGSRSDEAIDLVGGFIGALGGDDDSEKYGQICYSYAASSGSADDVRGANEVGGFAGRDAGVTYGCYSTCNVQGATGTGGFAGTLWGKSAVYDNQAYGLVQGVDGGEPDKNVKHRYAGRNRTGKDSTHGFTGLVLGYDDKYTADDSAGGKRPNSYLTGKGYNDYLGQDPWTFVDAKTYGELTVTDQVKGHPYSSGLGEAFPFATYQPPKGSRAQHYGDWPARAGITLQDLPGDVVWVGETRWIKASFPGVNSLHVYYTFDGSDPYTSPTRFDDWDGISPEKGEAYIDKNSQLTVTVGAVDTDGNTYGTVTHTYYYYWPIYNAGVTYNNGRDVPSGTTLGEVAKSVKISSGEHFSLAKVELQDESGATLDAATKVTVDGSYVLAITLVADDATKVLPAYGFNPNLLADKVMGQYEPLGMDKGYVVSGDHFEYLIMYVKVKVSGGEAGDVDPAVTVTDDSYSFKANGATYSLPIQPAPSGNTVPGPALYNINGTLVYVGKNMSGVSASDLVNRIGWGYSDQNPLFQLGTAILTPADFTETNSTQRSQTTERGSLYVEGSDVYVSLNGGAWLTRPTAQDATGWLNVTNIFSKQ